MTHTLMTFLGPGSSDPQARYREATYRFPDHSLRKTSFFGLELAKYLAVDRIGILGTVGSMWSVLVEHAALADEEESARIASWRPRRKQESTSLFSTGWRHCCGAPPAGMLSLA